MFNEIPFYKKLGKKLQPSAMDFSGDADRNIYDNETFRRYSIGMNEDFDHSLEYVEEIEVQFDGLLGGKHKYTG